MLPGEILKDGNLPPDIDDVDFEPFWKTWSLLEKNYVDSGKIDRQEVIWGAIEGAVGSLEDPYSVFLPPEESELFETSVRGDFQGVGMEIGMRDRILTVIAPIKNMPAEKAGIKAGDKILKINGETTDGLSTDEAALKIRGEKGTEVVLTIFREGKNESFDVKITRDTIIVPAIETEVKENGIFLIRMMSYSARSSSEFRDALRKMIESGSDKLIIDLRGNPGGYLEAAVDISSWFLPLGKVVAREKFSDGREELYNSRGYGLASIFTSMPIVILIDGGSASASEIMAGALREHGRAKLVGEKSYGKGSVQQMFDVAGGSSLKLTVAKWLTPNGVSLSEGGLDPDVEVKLTEEDKTDKQMEKAMEILNNL
jgi:carboxyl-terminal processing protease